MKSRAAENVCISVRDLDVSDQGGTAPVLKKE